MPPPGQQDSWCMDSSTENRSVKWSGMLLNSVTVCSASSSFILWVAVSVFCVHYTQLNMVIAWLSKGVWIHVNSLSASITIKFFIVLCTWPHQLCWFFLSGWNIVLDWLIDAKVTKTYICPLPRLRGRGELLKVPDNPANRVVNLRRLGEKHTYWPLKILHWLPDFQSYQKQWHL